MRVIFLTDVKAQGKQGQVKEVSEGYARNFLLPRKLAVEATSGHMTELKQQQEASQKRQASELEAARQLKQRLEALTVVLSAHAGEGGKLFGAITSKHIGDALHAMGIEIDRRKIVQPEPIRTQGEHRVDVKLHHDVTASLRVSVVVG